MSTYTKTPKYSNLSRKEAQEELDRLNNAVRALQAHLDTLPKNNHPAQIKPGMVFQYNDKGLYIVTELHGKYHLVSLVDGEVWCSGDMFGHYGPDAFKYMGHVKDVLMPKITVTREVVSKALAHYDEDEESSMAAMEGVLRHFVEGRFH